MQLLKHGGLYVSAGGANVTHPGYVETFARPDGPIGAPWDDAYYLNPVRWERTEVANGRLEVYPSHDNVAEGAQGAIANYLVGLWLITMDIGLSDNYEVGLQERIIINSDLCGQVDPCVCVDLEADDMELGLTATVDIGLPGSYFNRISHPPTTGHVQDPLYQHGFDLIGGGSGLGLTFGYPTMVIRLRNGRMARYHNGVKAAEIDVPEEFQGRTRVGLQVMGLSQRVGDDDDWNDVTPVPEVYPEICTRWWWRPFNGSL